MSDIANRLASSVKMDAINGNDFERSVCARQMSEASRYITQLENRVGNYESRVGYLEKAVEQAYRKHQLDDESIGWQELGNILCDELINSYGGEIFADWVMQFDNGEKSLAKFAKGYK